MHLRITNLLPSLTFRMNLCVLGTYFSTNLDCEGFSMSRSIARSVNSCQVRTSTCVFLDLAGTGSTVG